MNKNFISNEFMKLFMILLNFFLKHQKFLSDKDVGVSS